MMVVSSYANFYNDMVLQPSDWLYLGGVFLASLAILGISLLFYRKRKLECAGDLLSVSCLDPLFAVCAFLFGAAFMTTFDSGPSPMICFGAVIGYLAYWMLSKKTARVFTNRIVLGLVALLVIFGASCIAVESDPLGRVYYVPETAQIKTASLRTSPRSSERLETSDPEMIEAILELHGDLLDVAMDPEENYNGSQLHIVYELTNGQFVERNYTCSYEAVLSRGAYLLSQPEAMLGTEDPEITNVMVVHDYSDRGTLDPALIDELSAVILKECRSGVMFDFDYDYSPWELTVYLAGREPVNLWIPETALETVAWLEANCTLTE
jgi:hypothetical protein